jgi:hypothetical protein
MCCNADTPRPNTEKWKEEPAAAAGRTKEASKAVSGPPTIEPQVQAKSPSLICKSPFPNSQSRVAELGNWIPDLSQDNATVTTTDPIRVSSKQDSRPHRNHCRKRTNLHAVSVSHPFILFRGRRRKREGEAAPCCGWEVARVRLVLT